jgi:LemA protein
VTGAVSLGVLLVGLLVVGGIVVTIYNRLVRARILVREGFSGIDVQLKRRHNLIPNLVSTVEGYAEFEKSVLEDVTNLRTRAMGDQSMADKQRDENLLSEALKSLFAVAENYPDLKANTNFLDLQQQLAVIEDELQKARRYYNGTVRDYNTRVETFPSNLVASMFGFQPAEFFELESLEEATVPEVGFKFGEKE